MSVHMAPNQEKTRMIFGVNLIASKMKRTIFFFVTVVLAFSCTKDLEVVNPDNTPDPASSEVAASLSYIPTTLTATISDDAVKTAYDADGKFTWLSTDRVRLLVCEDLSTYSRQGIYSYKIKSLSSDSKTAVFTSTSSAGDLTAFQNGTWKSTGIAMYPESALDRFSTPESHGYGTPWFTLARGNVSGLASDILLTGMAMDDNSNYKFSTAMAVLKITVNNIPASAAKIKLVTSDKTNYPIDGDFALAKGTDGIVTTTFISTYVSDFKGYQAVDLSSEGEIASRDFYFNIPANTYPANTLSIRLEDANGGKIMVRTISKSLTLSRNDCLSLPALGYSHTVAFKNNCTADNPFITWTIDSHRIRFCVSTDENIDLSQFDSGYTFANDNPTGSYTGEYTLSSFANQKPSDTGKYYMHYLLQSDRGGNPTALDAANVIGYGTIPFYYISSADKSAFAKQYSFTSVDSGDGQNFWHPGTGSNYTKTMTLAVSKDVTKGNLMMTELYGKTAANKPLYGILSSSDGESISFTYNGDGDTDYFFQQNNNSFHVAQSADGLAIHSTSDVVFTIASGPVLTSEAYLMMKYTASYSPVNWREFVYGYQLSFQ